jgi:hypothetical protein
LGRTAVAEPDARAYPSAEGRWVVDEARTLDASIASGVVTIVVDDGNGRTSTIEASAADFEAAERGIAIGRRFIPWHRIHRYEWDLPPKDLADDRRSMARVRLLVDDGAGTEEHIVTADGFETGAFAVTMLVDVVHAENGTVAVRRIGFPWHRVREYERIPSDGVGDAL